MRLHLAALLTTFGLVLCLGVSCHSPQAKPGQDDGAKQLPRHGVEKAQTDGLIVKDNARPCTPQSNDGRTTSKQSSSGPGKALIDNPPAAPTSPLDLTLSRLATELRLKEQQDPARRAELEAEIVKLREQLQSLYDPVVQE